MALYTALVQCRRGSLGTTLEAAFHRCQVHMKTPLSPNPGNEADRKWLSVGLIITGPEPEPTSWPVSGCFLLSTLPPSKQYVQLAVGRYVL